MREKKGKRISTNSKVFRMENAKQAQLDRLTPMSHSYTIIKISSITNASTSLNHTSNEQMIQDNHQVKHHTITFR